MPTKLLIDADPGISDALTVLAAMADPSIDLLALTGVAGTVSGQQATRNLQFLTGIADPLRHPRIGQSDTAVAPADAAPVGMPSHYLLNGRFGLGDVEPEVPDLHNRRESAKLICDVAREFPQQLSVLCLGPLTNLAMAMDLDAELPNLLDSITILGGAFAGGGDVTSAAEFNIWADPGAAQVVLNANVRKRLIPRDVSDVPLLTFDDVDRLTGLIPSTPAGECINSMLLFAVRSSRQHLPTESVSIPAAHALSVVAGTASAQGDAGWVEIELQGRITTGMTVLERRSVRNRLANCEIITSTDHHAVTDTLCLNLRRVG
ncbi:MAG: nucleoside hydrolase [Planctomycetaceae bacterium]|nr:nucleoside hydrolase [Planctomycetaceae bacterium]